MWKKSQMLTSKVHSARERTLASSHTNSMMDGWTKITGVFRKDAVRIMSLERADGGSAFPRPEQAGIIGESGMSRRDYFAAAALERAYIQPPVYPDHISQPPEDALDDYAERAAREAYRIADAMLIKGDKGQPGIVAYVVGRLSLAMDGCSACDYDEAKGGLINHCDACCRKVTAEAYQVVQELKSR